MSSRQLSSSEKFFWMLMAFGLLYAEIRALAGQIALNKIYTSREIDKRIMPSGERSEMNPVFEWYRIWRDDEGRVIYMQLIYTNQWA